MFDIAIVGGGLIGRALCIALQNTHLSIVLIESQPFMQSSVLPPLDRRSIALTPQAVSTLKKWGVWAHLESHCTPVHHIHVSNQGYWGFTRIHAQEEGLESLGYRVLLDHIAEALSVCLPSEVKVVCPAKVTELCDQTEGMLITLQQGDCVNTIEARCVIGADGAHSFVRQALGISVQTKDYDQVAIVGGMRVSEPHGHWAYERFTPFGPFAILPGPGHTVSFVWTLSSQVAQEMLQENDSVFLNQAQITFGYRVGRFLEVGQKGSYPLKLVTADALVAKHAILIGNAAQSLHPVAGQGFNLGLRDIAVCAQYLEQKGVKDLSWLAEYESARQTDRNRMIRTTHTLVRGFSHQLGPVHHLSSLLMVLLERVPFLKSKWNRRFMGHSVNV